MNFKAAKCPNCGGELQVPDDKDSVACMYCKGEIIVREAIRLASGVNVKNLMELGESSITSMNFEESYKYYSQILEHDINNYKAWIGKGISRIEDKELLTTCVDKAISIEKDSEKLLNEIINSIKYLNKAKDKRLILSYLRIINERFVNVGLKIELAKCLPFVYFDKSISEVSEILSYVDEDNCRKEISISYIECAKKLFINDAENIINCLSFAHKLDATCKTQIIKIIYDKIKLNKNLFSEYQSKINEERAVLILIDYALNFCVQQKMFDDLKILATSLYKTTNGFTYEHKVADKQWHNALINRYKITVKLIKSGTGEGEKKYIEYYTKPIAAWQILAFIALFSLAIGLSISKSGGKPASNNLKNSVNYINKK